MASFNVCRRYFSSSHSASNIFNHVTVIGGGLMGSGIAQVTAQAGMDVTVVEVSEEAIKKCDANIKNSMQKVAKKLFQNSSTEAEKYISETMGRVKISLDLPQVVSSTDLVVEAIVEHMPAKHKLFSQIDSIAPEHAVFASNTSSLSIAAIASVTRRKDKFGGLHFFNPVPVMKLLEVIRTKETSEDTYQKMMAWGKAIGKICITCKDTPGFVVNKLLIPYLAEAVRMLDRGDACAKDIDTAMKLGAGYPMGPLELLDYVGLDTTKFILDGWHAKDPKNPLYAPIDLLNKLVSEGKLGKKTGEGFYVYKKSLGTFSFPFHYPYLQFSVLAEKPPSQLPKPSKEQPTFEEVIKETKLEKSDSVNRLEEPKKLIKMESQDRLKKVYKVNSLWKWKNSDEFLFERDKTNLNLKQGSAKPIVENYKPRIDVRPRINYNRWLTEKLQERRNCLKMIECNKIKI